MSLQKLKQGVDLYQKKKISSIAIVFNTKSIKTSVLSKLFRQGETPVIGFVKNDKFYIDLKAVLPNQLIKLSQAINKI